MGHNRIISPLSPALPEYLLPFGESPRAGKHLFGSHPLLQYETLNNIRMMQVTRRLNRLNNLQSGWFLRYSFINNKLFMITFMQPTPSNSHQPNHAETIQFASMLSPGMIFPSHFDIVFNFMSASHLFQIYNGLFCSQIRITELTMLTTLSDSLTRFINNWEISKNIHSVIKVYNGVDQFQPA